VNVSPYTNADRTIRTLRRKAVRRFQAAKSKAAAKGFDELNVISIVKYLYNGLEKDNEKFFLELAVMAYQNARPHGRTPPNKKWLNELLKDYDPVTFFIYMNEVERKRDRAAEAINAAKNKGYEFKKALSYWHRQTAQYADIITDEARLKAFKDAGVKRVRWNTQKDERVCEDCEPLDGQVFDIDKAPAKEHWGCRCYYTAVMEGKK